jgi:hypothetical protein
MPSDFQIAHDRAVARASMRGWSNISPRDRVEAIFRELRALDAERAAEQAQQSSMSGGRTTSRKITD